MLKFLFSVSLKWPLELTQREETKVLMKALNLSYLDSDSEVKEWIRFMNTKQIQIFWCSDLEL